MSKDDNDSLREAILKHPLLEKLNELTFELAGIRLLAVFPENDGWGQFGIGITSNKPDFCQLIQTTSDGAKHCKMCHVLMSIAACSAGQTEQQCHAGLSVLISPVPDKNGQECFSVLSSCMFTSPNKRKVWLQAAKRGRKLGLKPEQLKKAFDELPVLTAAQAKIVRSLMAIAGESIREIKTRIMLQGEVSRLRNRSSSHGIVESTLNEQLRNFGKKLPETALRCNAQKGAPALVRVVEELVSRRPDIPYSVTEIAAAARMTPNHFSSLFHRHKGQTFSEFLTTQRMNAAKTLLKDLTLNISEVAQRVGCKDAGYFTRRFRQMTGTSPRKWRDNL